MSAKPTSGAFLKACVGLVFLLAAAGLAQAQPRPGDTLTITAAPGLVNFVLAPSGISNGSSAVTITTMWSIRGGGTQVSLYACFNTPAMALTNGGVGPGNVIPSANVRGSINGGGFAPFTGSGPFSVGGSMRIYTEQVRRNKNRVRTDTLALQINTTGLSLGAGTFTGILRIQAQAI